MLALQYRTIGPGQGHQAGRQLLQEMMLALTHAPMPRIRIGQYGKPFFENSQVHFSITHTKGHVFCTLSDKPLGIDAEELDRQVSPKLAGKILSEFELAQYEAAQDKRIALLTFWVLKEAHAKCLGTGLRGWPNHTAFSLDDPRVTQIDGCLVAVIEKENDHAL